jgi:hypothetical protein
VSVFVPAFPPHVAPELARVEEWWRFARLRERVEHDPSSLAEIRAELAPVEAALWEEADACRPDAVGSAARSDFAAHAFEPVDRALRRLGV